MESCSSCSSAPHPKYDWYQTDAKVVVSILAKNVKPESVRVHFSPHNVSTAITLAGDEECTLNFDLSQHIVAEKCSFKVTSSKVEIHLAKESAARWDSLEQKVETPKPKTGAKNWDALAKNMASDLDEESVNTLFNKIYSDGSDEQKRAMLKSYYESGGTVLSTDWKEVSKQKVEVKPPDGVEFKPWNH